MTPGQLRLIMSAMADEMRELNGQHQRINKTQLQTALIMEAALLAGIRRIDRMTAEGANEP